MERCFPTARPPDLTARLAALESRNWDSRARHAVADSNYLVESEKRIH